MNLNKLRKIISASRPLSWINTAFPFGAAYLLGGGRIDLTLVLGIIFFLIPYNIAMYGINDVFDYESDLVNARKGGIEGALVPPVFHRTLLRAAIITPLPFAAYFLYIGSWSARAILLLSLFAVVAYSAKYLRFKEIPFLDAITSSTHFSSPAWLGLALAPASLSPTWALVFAAFFAWGMASQAFGAIQDISADRSAGIKSIATVLGARNTVYFALFGYLLAAVFLGLSSLGWVIALVPTLPYLISTVRFINLSDAECTKAHRGWTTFLWLNYAVGFVITMLMLFL